MNSIFDEKEQRAIDKALKIIEKKIIKREVSLTNPYLVEDYLRLQLEGKHDEHFGIVFLDNQHRVIESRIISVGTIDAAAIYPRTVLKHCLDVNSPAILLYHNHPSGVSSPSSADKTITSKLSEALALVDIRILDHLIIGSGEMFSFANAGLI